MLPTTHGYQSSYRHDFQKNSLTILEHSEPLIFRVLLGSELEEGQVVIEESAHYRRCKVLRAGTREARVNLDVAIVADGQDPKRQVGGSRKAEDPAEVVFAIRRRHGVGRQGTWGKLLEVEAVEEEAGVQSLSNKVGLK